jgi:hypothetical protein
MARKAKQRADPAAGAFRVGLEYAQLPPSFLNLINGNVIDVSGASDFYKKKAEVANLLENFVERCPDSHYRLKNQFDRYFLASLPVFLRGHPMGPADVLADAVFFLGRQWARIDNGKLPLASIPEDEFLRDQWTGAADWDTFLLKDACIGEVWWHNLGRDGKVQRWTGESVPGDFELRVDFGCDTTKPPMMAIRIKGEAAALFMKWWMTLNPNSPPERHPGVEALRERASTVLDSLTGVLKMNLKLLRPERGRPRADFGERAAYLLDHEKKNLALIARELCHLSPTASPSVRRQCFDRIRKAANNYYKLLRNDYTTLTTVRVRQRIIRIPGDPNAVKSE